MVIFAAGTGNPFFSTDTAAALRALEIGAECHPHGQEEVRRRLRRRPGDRSRRHASSPGITHREALERGLRVMDSTALSLCMDNGLPIMVFNMSVPENIRRVLRGERVGTVVSCDADEACSASRRRGR